MWSRELSVDFRTFEDEVPPPKVGEEKNANNVLNKVCIAVLLILGTMLVLIHYDLEPRGAILLFYLLF